MSTMGPPLSPRETRRSGRRSAPSVSASTSKSPDSDQPARQKDTSSRVPSSSAGSGGRNKRLKQEDYEESPEDRRNYPASSTTSSVSNSTSKAKRKAKDKDKDKEKDKQESNTNSGDQDVVSIENQVQDPPEEEEQGITRCVCGSAEDDHAGEFMVQCETCKVWQHVLCMGYQSLEQVNDDDYYCEQCRPELHMERLKKAKRPRQASAASRQDPTNSRVSRSHSPSHLKQPSKRRNTMNSRDAAFDESLKEIIEATAAEAAAVHDAFVISPNEAEPVEVVSGGKKKRKRTDDESTTKKRTRSASTASDGQSGTAPPGENAAVDKAPAQSSKPSGRNKRGGRKTAVADVVPIESEEAVPASTKRQGNSSRAKAANAVKRPPLCQSTSNGSTAGIHEHGTRRNQAAGSSQHTAAGTADSSRAYRNSHAYAVSQQSFFTSWNLPDYLSHLEQMLPTDTPQPLEVSAGISSISAPGSRGDGSERTMERGVKVKWPSKRMSVGDMNKRVRALVEWVGREQAGALDRGRRREALEKALRKQPANVLDDVGPAGDTDMAMVVDEATAGDPQNKETDLSFASQAISELALEMSTSTMKMMEELMEELIGFQERFGPGAKHREREKRLAKALHKLESDIKRMESSIVNAFLNEDAGNLSNDEPDLSHSGDYSSHMEQLFDGETEHGDDPYEEEESFIYNGADVVDTPTGYQERLLDVLELDHNEDDESEFDVLEVENSLVYDQHTDDEPLQHVDDIFSEDSPSISSSGPSTPPSHISSPGSKASYFKLARPFLHPTVSRLRSYHPQASSKDHDSNVASSHSHLFDGTYPSPSRFSSISRISSMSNLQIASSAKQDDAFNGEKIHQVFRWTELQAIMQTIYTKLSPKASGLLGASSLGRPTVLAANGLICTGTDDGKVVVHDFKQSLICICESNLQGSSPGAVTAVALSHDHTFVVSGHVTGHITLYNLKNPRNPVRCVPPTTLAAVSTGRKEGHLQGSKIINVGFVAGRHTGIVSADDHGLAFFHSLGKLLFVEASDILRILGRYPDDSFPRTSLKTPLLSSSIPAFSPMVNGHQQRKIRYTILAMSPLPLGTAPHATDNYQPVALLTPTKLVVIGLKPSPRTWFKCPREVDEGGSWRSRSKWIGSLAWFPCVLSQSGPEMVQPGRTLNDCSTTPMLAYSWGSSLHIINVAESKIKQVVKNPTSGKTTEIEVGTLIYQRFGHWTADDDIVSVQWLNANQIIVITRGHLGVYDLKAAKLIDQIAFDDSSLVSLTADKLLDADNGRVAHSVRVYKGKVFLLERDRLVVGTLLTWADRVLSLVQDGDFLGAIDLVQSYYIDEAPGNRNNLPDDPNLRKQMIGEKLRSLMDASTQYTFSEDRMTDSTHITPDNRGVDRTSLFEGLVTVCCRACVALDDFEFLFEDLFQRYDDSGISSIYLRQLEPFVLSNEIRYVPARITQKLVALHEKDGRPDHVERIIWHMDPSCLDLNQAIHICQQYHLYDALIYIYTRAMRDYVAPIVVLLDLIRQVRQYRRSQVASLKTVGTLVHSDSILETTIMDAYKIYPYLANALSGLTYPSEDPLTQEEALHAKKKVYTFLFFGRSSVWPEGEGGKLVLTSDEEGGVEPTYPYVRQLLLFDAESFLHSLDIAFEDAYLNDKSLTINRLMIVRILLEILSSGSLLQEDATLVNIFIARNVPKYPQFLEIAPTALHSILIGLAEDPDPKTREDRQLAAEYLLSIYNPHESERVTALFESAGFFRILRAWYHHDRRWAQLLSTYIHDPDTTSLNLLDKIEEVILVSSRINKGIFPNELIPIVSSSLSRLLDASVAGTAALIDRLIPELHSQALETFDTNPNADKSRHEYLQSLLHPSDEGGHIWQKSDHNHNVPQSLQQLFIALQCRFNPTEVIPTLQHLVKDTLDLSEILETCESNEVYDAVVWAINWQGDPQRALLRADASQKRISLKILKTLDLDPRSPIIARELDSLQAIAKVSRLICLERSRGSSIEIPLEDMWFTLLNSQIHSVQIISGSIQNHPSGDTDSIYSEQETEVERLLSSLRSLVQTTFSTLVTVTSTSAVSFPRLFKRLVNSTPQSTGSYYNEFRMILTGMLESYRSDEDLLIMLKHLLDRDLFDIVAQVTRERASGWVSRRETCQYCRKSLMPLSVSPLSRGPANVNIHQIVVSRTGAIYHTNCGPPDAFP